jgi:hypothetical protein
VVGAGGDFPPPAASVDVEAVLAPFPTAAVDVEAADGVRAGEAAEGAS